MAYVRTHGKQNAIVHGERDPGSGKVQQRVLFTLYSRPEALAALGRREGEENNRWNFQGLLELKHPAIRFDWKRIQAGVEERLDQLPESHPYRPGEFLGWFREDLCAFARQLELADPQTMFSAAELLQQQRHELEHLRDLIGWRLKLCDQQEGRWNTDNRFFWRYRLRSEQVPHGLMEKMAGLWERGEHERLGTLARFFVECLLGAAWLYLGEQSRARAELGAAGAVEGGRCSVDVPLVYCDLLDGVRQGETPSELGLEMSLFISAVRRADEHLERGEAEAAIRALDHHTLWTRGELQTTARRAWAWLQLSPEEPGQWAAKLIALALLVERALTDVVGLALDLPVPPGTWPRQRILEVAHQAEAWLGRAALDRQPSNSCP